MKNLRIKGREGFRQDGNRIQSEIELPINQSWAMAMEITAPKAVNHVLTGNSVWDKESPRKNFYAIAKNTGISGQADRLKVGNYVLFIRNGNFNSNPGGVVNQYEQQANPANGVSFTAYLQSQQNTGNIPILFSGPDTITTITLSGILHAPVNVNNPVILDNMERLISFQAIQRTGTPLAVLATDTRKVIAASGFSAAAFRNIADSCSGVLLPGKIYQLVVLPGRIENAPGNYENCYVVTGTSATATITVLCCD